MSFTCVVCMNTKRFDTLMMNIRCGHACICEDCQSQLPFTIFTENACPLCRRNGEYRRVHINIDGDITSDELMNNNYPNNQIVNENENNNIDIIVDIEQNNDPRVIKLRQILYEGISANYFILTYEKHNYFNPKDDRLENMVMAFYGTEQCMENNNKPFFIDVTRRVQLAINIRRQIFIVNDENLLKMNHTMNTKNWLITILCVR